MNRPLRTLGLALSALTVAMVLSAQLSARPAISVALHVEESQVKLDKPSKARVARMVELRRNTVRPACELA